MSVARNSFFVALFQSMLANLCYSWQIRTEFMSPSLMTLTSKAVGQGMLFLTVADFFSK